MKEEGKCRKRYGVCFHIRMRLKSDSESVVKMADTGSSILVDGDS